MKVAAGLSFFSLLCIGSIPLTLVEGAALGRKRRTAETARGISFLNLSGRRVDLLWVNTNSNPVTYSSHSDDEGFPHGGGIDVNSFAGHKFELREIPGRRSKKCVDEPCWKSSFVVNNQEDQKVTVYQNFTMIHTDRRQNAQNKADELLSECNEEINQRDGQQEGSSSSSDKKMSALEKINAISECMERKMEEAWKVHQEEVNFQTKIRTEMADQIVPFACADTEFESTEEVYNRTWQNEEIEGYVKSYNTRFLHQRPLSTIFVIDKFATPNQCKAAEAFVTSRDDDPENVHGHQVVPFISVNDQSANGLIIHELGSKMYQAVRELLKWEELDFNTQYAAGQELFEVYTDTLNPHLKIKQPCNFTSNDDDNDGTDDESTKEQEENDDDDDDCRLFGENFPTIRTREFHISDEKQLLQTFLFCGEQPKTLGGISFPYAGVHVNPERGMLVVAMNQPYAVQQSFDSNTDDNNDGGNTDQRRNYFDGYVQDYHLCPNHKVFTHTIVRTE